MEPVTLYRLAIAGIAIGLAALSLGVVLRMRAKERLARTSIPSVGRVVSSEHDAGSLRVSLALDPEAVRRANLPFKWGSPIADVEARREAISIAQRETNRRPAEGEPEFRSRRSPRAEYGRVVMGEPKIALPEPLSPEKAEALRAALKRASESVRRQAQSEIDRTLTAPGLEPLSAAEAWDRVREITRRNPPRRIRMIADTEDLHYGVPFVDPHGTDHAYLGQFRDPADAPTGDRSFPPSPDHIPPLNLEPYRIEAERPRAATESSREGPLADFGSQSAPDSQGASTGSESASCDGSD